MEMTVENNVLIYRKIRDGKMSLEEFIKWVETEAEITHRSSYHEGYLEGYRDGEDYGYSTGCMVTEANQS